MILGRNLQSTQRDTKVREALHTASQRLQSAADLKTVIDATMEGVEQVVPCVGVCVHLLNEQATEVTIAGLRGFKYKPGDVTTVVGFKYPADDSVLNRRTLLDHEAFYLHDFQVEGDTWQNPEAPTLRAWMSVPLMSQGRCLGKITLDHELPDVYGPEEIAIVQTFAAHAASAIERAYLFAETASRADQLAALYEISQELVAARDERSLYEILRRGAMRAFAADLFELRTADCGLRIDDYQNNPGDPGDPGGSVNPQSAIRNPQLVAPLTWSGTTLGVISIQTYRDRQYTQGDFQAFQALGATAALALARIRSEAATAERAAQFAALAQSARALVGNLDLSDVLQTVVDGANELTGGEAFLMLHNPEDDKLHVRTFAGVSLWHRDVVQHDTLGPNEGVGGVAYTEQHAILIDDMQKDKRARYQGESPMRSLLVLPLTVGQQRMGILELVWPEPGAVTPERLALCTAFADHAALAIDNAHQHEQLRQREAERTALLRQLLTAQEAERKRVSIDLHDGPLQSLGVGLINADTLRKRSKISNITADDIDALRLDFAAVVDEVRGLIADLRPEVLDSYGLLPALEAHARRIQETANLDIVIECDLDDRLPAFIEVLIYRLVQESLSNVRKHAQATTATVNVSVDEGRGIVMTKVMDDGRGFNPRQMPVRKEGFGLGLGSMAERAESAGGTMTVESAPGGPTILTFQIPLPSARYVVPGMR
jgi:signal transduction histidine kinase